jgi:hypothetical protein
MMTKSDILKELDDLGWQNAKTDDDRTRVRRGVSLVVAMMVIDHIDDDMLKTLQVWISRALTEQDAPPWLSPSVH